jgi:hypothetical protein
MYRHTGAVTPLGHKKIQHASESKAKELYYQDPSFGYAVLQMVIARLMEDMSALVEFASRAKI